jgi:hypothetical protein
MILLLSHESRLGTGVAPFVMVDCPLPLSSASRDDVGVAADGLKYSELARLRQAMNQVHHVEPVGEEQLPGFLTRLRCGRNARGCRDRKNSGRASCATVPTDP